VPGKRRTRQRLADSTVAAERFAAEAPESAWAIESQSDQTAVGHDLKLPHVVDEFIRAGLRIGRHRRLDAEITVATVDRLIAWRGMHRRPSPATTGRR
jgi:hypothetical protein